MADLLTTSDIAQMYGLADSTVRHYRASGRLVPQRRTPGGHARYALAEVIATLGPPVSAAPPIADDVRITGLGGETFAPPGQHDVRSSGRVGVRPSVMVALSVREAIEPPGRSHDGPRWGGRRVMRPRARVVA